MKKKQNERWVYPFMVGVIWAIILASVSSLLYVLVDEMAGVFSVFVCVICFKEMAANWAKAIEMKGE